MMKKAIHKIIALLFIGMTIFGGLVGGMTGNAATTGAFPNRFASGGVAPDEGTLTIHKYLLGEEPAGEAGTGTVAGDASQLPSDAKLINGVVFDVYKTGALAFIANPDNTNTMTAASDAEKEKYAVPTAASTDEGTTVTYSIYEYNGTDYIRVVSQKGTGSNAPVTEFLYEIDGTKLTGTTAVDGTVTFGKESAGDGLPKGYYLVVEDVGSSNPVTVDGEATTVINSAPAMVAVPMTNPATDATDENRWIVDVHVSPKNEPLVPEKSVDQEDGVAVGDILEYKITVEIPNIDPESNMWFKDKLPQGLELVDNSVLVALSETAGTVSEIERNHATLVKDVHYTLAIDQNVNETLRVVVSPSTMSSLVIQKGKVQTIGGSQDTYTPNYINVIFQARVTADAFTEGGSNIIENTAEVGTTDPDSGTGGAETPPTKTPMADLEINKFARNDFLSSETTQLEGATFRLTTTAGLGEDPVQYILVKYDATNATLPAHVVYPEDDDYATAAADSDYVPYEITSDADGKLTFHGLKVGTNVFLEEIKAPNGYNLLTDRIEISLDKPEDPDIEADFSYIYEQDVENNKGFTLPNTGSIAAIIMVIIGIVLIGLAIIIKISKKKQPA